MLAKHEEEQFSMFEEQHREEEHRRELLRHIRRWQEDLEEWRRLREEEEAMLNQRELLKHLLKKEVEEQERAEKELKQKGLEQKLQRSKKNHMLLLEAQVQEMRSRAAKEEEQMRMAQHLRGGRTGIGWSRSKCGRNVASCRRMQKERAEAEAQERSRKVAHASCYTRERVREQTSRHTFDRMAREAELNWATWNYE
uniref:Uncharacterized protein n=1 Tax=Sinocyclocheilus grahami TaxID=75366 RepID=A0A672L027_SINGR